MDLEEESKLNKLNDLATLLGSRQKLLEYQGLKDDADRVQAFMRSPAISVLLKTKDGGCKDAKSVSEGKRYKELGNQVRQIILAASTNLVHILIIIISKIFRLSSEAWTKRRCTYTQSLQPTHQTQRLKTVAATTTTKARTRKKPAC